MPKFGASMLCPQDMNGFLQKLHQNSIDAYEIGFADGVQDDFPQKTIELAKELNIKLSAHIPFFLSWANEEKTHNSVRHILKGIRFAVRLQTLSVCHLGHYGNKTFQELKGTVIKEIKNAIDMAKEYYDGRNPVLGIETTGKKSEIGTLDEVISTVSELSTNISVPVIDWAHIFARSDGKFPRSVDDFRQVLTRLENEIGIKSFYFHGSGIEYKNAQEKKHLSVKTCKPPLPYLLAVLKDAGYDYTLIIESPNAIADLMWIKEVSKNPESWFGYVQRQSGLLERWITT